MVWAQLFGLAAVVLMVRHRLEQVELVGEARAALALVEMPVEIWRVLARQTEAVMAGLV
jgi:hypothetical protein